MSTSAPLLAALSSSAPDLADVVTVGDRSLSSQALLAAASALADRIAGAPLVAVDAYPSLETVVAVVAGLVAGVPVVPVAPDAGPLERAHILRDSGAPIVVATGSGSAGPADPDVERIAVDLDASGSSGGGPSMPEPPEEHSALILYTSGTTGPPKGVVLSRRAIAADLDALADAWAWTPDDVVVHGLPLFHVHGLVLGMLGPLRTGGRVVHTERPRPAALAAAVAEGGGTMVFGVPTVWSRIVADPASASRLRTARVLVSGSAPLPAPVFSSIEQRCGQRPIERYGMTESLITLSTRADGERRLGSVGLPLVGVATRIIGEDGQPVPADDETVGSLQVRSPTLMDGYLGRPEETASVLGEDGWFRTGDAACLAPDGFHRIVGRESIDLIKTGGYRVGAGEVEAALLGHPGVQEAAVVGVPDEDLGQAIVAYVVADAVTPETLIGWVADRLSVHKRPRQVELVDSLPRNAMGKVQKARLGGRTGGSQP